MRRWLPEIALGVLVSILSSTAWAGITWAWHRGSALQRQVNALENARLTPAPIPPAVAPLPEIALPAREVRSGETISGRVDPDDRASVEGAWAAELVDRVGRLELANLYAQADTESRFQPAAVSPVGARGVAQFMPRTWAEEAPRTEPSCEGVQPTDVGCSARAQQSYMQRVEGWLPRGARNIENTWAAYNWGAGNVRKAVRQCEAALGCDPENWRDMEHMVPHETKRYVKRNKRVSVGLRRGSFDVSFEF